MAENDRRGRIPRGRKANKKKAKKRRGVNGVSKIDARNFAQKQHKSYSTPIIWVAKNSVVDDLEASRILTRELEA